MSLAERLSLTLPPGKFRMLADDEYRELVAQARGRFASGWPARDLASASLPEIALAVAEAFGGITLVRVLWVSHGAGVELPVALLAQHLDDLWFPGADDIFIAAPHFDRLALLDHEERLSVAGA